MKTWEKKCLPVALVHLLLLSISASHFNYFFPLSSQQQFGITPGFCQSGMLDRRLKELNYVVFSPASENLWLRRIICASEQCDFFPPPNFRFYSPWQFCRSGMAPLPLSWHWFVDVCFFLCILVCPFPSYLWFQAPFHSSTNTRFIIIHTVVEARTRIVTSCA